jgi:hypothetical protein
MSSVHHDNLVKVYGVGFCSDGRPYLAYEYIEGKQLSDFCRQPMAESASLDFCQQLCKAVEAINASGIIHRDIKPANILIDNQNCLKLVDFGVVKLTDGDGASQKLTQTGTITGSPTYMAPELLCEGKATFASEVYSIGCVLYEMLEGRQAFATDNLMELVSQKQSGAPKLTQRTAQSDQLQILLDDSLSADPIYRYQSVEEFHTALCTVVRGGKLEKRSPQAKSPLPGGMAPHRASRFFRKSWQLLAGLLAVLAVIGIYQIYESTGTRADRHNLESIVRHLQAAGKINEEVTDRLRLHPDQIPAEKLNDLLAQTEVGLSEYTQLQNQFDRERRKIDPVTYGKQLCKQLDVTTDTLDVLLRHGIGDSKHKHFNFAGLRACLLVRRGDILALLFRYGEAAKTFQEAVSYFQQEARDSGDSKLLANEYYAYAEYELAQVLAKQQQYTMSTAHLKAALQYYEHLQGKSYFRAGQAYALGVEVALKQHEFVGALWCLNMEYECVKHLSTSDRQAAAQSARDAAKIMKDRGDDAHARDALELADKIDKFNPFAGEESKQ